jgi:hypothetical protein
MKNVNRLIGRLAGVAACFALLASCFIPDKFEAEVRLTKDGSYGLTYIGVLTYGPLFSEIARGEIDDEHAKKSIGMFLAQLKRDSDFKEVESMGRGRFKVRYERTGKFGGSHQTVTFVSRQEPIFRVLTTEKGTVEVNGSGQGRLYADRLEEVGLTTQGLMRVVTDMEVVAQNAQSIRKSVTPGFTQYDWRFRSFRDLPPHFVAKLGVDPRTGVPAYSGGAGVNVEPEEEKKK